MEPKAELHHTSESDIVENFKDLSVGREEASEEKTGVSGLKIDAQTSKGEPSSSKASKKAPLGNDVSQNHEAKVQEGQTSIKDTLRRKCEKGPPSHLRHLFDLARNDEKPSLITVEILEEEVCVHDLMPCHPFVRHHFGFSKVDSVEEETCLQGLYKGLFILPRSPSRGEILDWVQEDKLADGIESYYSKCKSQSGYFNWFKKNKHVLSRNYERVGGPWKPAGTSFALDMAKLHELTKNDTESEDEDFDDDDGYDDDDDD